MDTFTPFDDIKDPICIDHFESACMSTKVTEVDALLEQMTFEQMTTKESFNPDSHGYPALEIEDHEKEVMFNPNHSDRAVCLTIKPWQRVFYPPADPKSLRKFFGYRPTKIIAKTLDCTT